MEVTKWCRRGYCDTNLSVERKDLGMITDESPLKLLFIIFSPNGFVFVKLSKRPISNLLSMAVLEGLNLFNKFVSLISFRMSPRKDFPNAWSTTLQASMDLQGERRQCVEVGLHSCIINKPFFVIIHGTADGTGRRSEVDGVPSGSVLRFCWFVRSSSACFLSTLCGVADRNERITFEVCSLQWNWSIFSNATTDVVWCTVSSLSFRH